MDVLQENEDLRHTANECFGNVDIMRIELQQLREQNLRLTQEKEDLSASLTNATRPLIGFGRKKSKSQQVRFKFRYQWRLSVGAICFECRIIHSYQLHPFAEFADNYHGLQFMLSEPLHQVNVDLRRSSASPDMKKNLEISPTSQFQ